MYGLSILSNRYRIFFPILFFLLITFLIQIPVIASDNAHQSAKEAVENTGEGESHEEAGHSGDRRGDLLDLLYRFINFALLVIILGVVVKKANLKDLLSLRSEEIRKKMDDLKRDKEEAEKRYLEIEKQLREFDKERSNIIEQYKKEGQLEKDKIIADAKKRVQQIIDQSELTIQQEIQSARDHLRQDIIELAAQQAREIIAKEMDEKDQDKLIDEFIEKVGKEH